MWRKMWFGPLLSIAVAGSALCAEPSPLAGQKIAQAFEVDGLLWLLSDKGDLASMKLADGRWGKSAASDVLDVDKAPGGLYLLSRQGDDYAIDTLTQGVRKRLTRFAASAYGAAPVLLSAKGKVVVLGINPKKEGFTAFPPPGVGIYEVNRNRWRTLTVTPSAEAQPVWAQSYGSISYDVSLNGEDLYIGFYRGEFGGGLFRIRLSDGVLTQVKALGRAPVTAVEPDPAHADCVLFATGLDHGMPHGAIHRACAGNFIKIFERPKEGQFSGLTEVLGEIVTDKDGFWAGGSYQYFRVENGEEIASHKPVFADFGGVAIDKAARGLVLVKRSPGDADYWHIQARRDGP